MVPWVRFIQDVKTTPGRLVAIHHRRSGLENEVWQLPNDGDDRLLTVLGFDQFGGRCRAIVQDLTIFAQFILNNPHATDLWIWDALNDKELVSQKTLDTTLVETDGPGSQRNDCNCLP
jgi:hypothetical protein